MAKKWIFLIGLSLSPWLRAAPVTDPFVKNLTLIGVIHVEGNKTKGQSVAVLREKASGRTLIMHKGDMIMEADLELRDLAPQKITLVRGTQQFILRVENQPETSEASVASSETPDAVESSEEVIATESLENPATILGGASRFTEAASEDVMKAPKPTPRPTQRFEPPILQESECEAEDCGH